MNELGNTPPLEVQQQHDTFPEVIQRRINALEHILKEEESKESQINNADRKAEVAELLQAYHSLTDKEVREGVDTEALEAVNSRFMKLINET